MTRQASVCRVLMALAVLLLARQPGRAQTADEDTPALPSGTRLRVTLDDGPGAESGKTKLVGQLAGLGPDSIDVAVGSAERRIPRDSIVKLERSVRPSRKGRGALIGFGVGFAAMFALLSATSDGDCFHSVGFCSGWSAVLALPAGVVGAVVAPGEEWADVPLRHGPAPASRSASDGLQLRVVPLVGKRTGVALAGSF
jgi:hypothetical protein